MGLTAGDEGDEEERAGKVAPEGDEPVEEHFLEAEPSVHDCYCGVLLNWSIRLSVWVEPERILFTMKVPVHRSTPVRTIMTKP